MQQHGCKQQGISSDKEKKHITMAVEGISTNPAVYPTDQYNDKRNDTGQYKYQSAVSCLAEEKPAERQHARTGQQQHKKNTHKEVCVRAVHAEKPYHRQGKTGIDNCDELAGRIKIGFFLVKRTAHVEITHQRTKQ